MFEGLFQPTHLLLILIVALLVFGPKESPVDRQGARRSNSGI